MDRKFINMKEERGGEGVISDKGIPKLFELWPEKFTKFTENMFLVSLKFVFRDKL